VSKLTRILSESIPQLGSSEIEGQLRRTRYYHDNYRDDDAEGGGFPPFIQPFYIWLCEHQRVPSADEHVNLYFALYPWAGAACQRGLVARINRAWPSLVRDVHLRALLREGGINVTYSMDWDTAAGIDLVAWPPEASGRSGLFIHAYVYTPRAVRFRSQKPNGRRHLDLPLLKHDAQIVNGVWLYQCNPHVETVRLAL
jgi:hypothetical protein